MVARILAAGWLALCLLAPARAQEAEEMMAKVRAKYRDVSDFRADLELLTCSALSGTCQRFEGRLEMKKPNRMRMEIKKPEPQQIVCDGSSLWLYLESERQVVRTDLAESRDYLMMLNPLDRLLKAKCQNGCNTNGEYQCWLEITELKGTLKEIKVIIDRKTLLITGIDVTDINDNSSEYRFKNVKLNVGIKDSRFDFVVPPKARLIDAN
jgi:outer membrane lipoprotein carrier protein